MTTMTDSKAAEVLESIQLGVEMDRHCLDDGQDRLDALSHATARLRDPAGVPSLEWLEANHTAWIEDDSDISYLTWLRNAMLASAPQPPAETRMEVLAREQEQAWKRTKAQGGGEVWLHPDDAAVDAFAVAMKAKLAAARAKGRGGWNDDEPGVHERLSDMLRAHVEKGDPRDVANFAMFLHQRGEAILPAHQTALSAPVGVEAMPGIRRELAGIVRRGDAGVVSIEPNEAAAILRSLAQQPAPVAPVGVEGLKERAWELLQAEYDRDYFAGNYEDAAVDAIIVALAQQPSVMPVRVEDVLGIDADDSANYIEHCAAHLDLYGQRVTAAALRAIAGEHRALARQSAADEEAAEQAAKAFNERYAPIAERTGVMAKAVVAEWPHSPESHAESVGTFLFDWIIPAGQAAEAQAQGGGGLSDEIIEALDSLDDDADHLRATGDPAMSGRVRSARNVLHAAIFRNTPPSVKAQGGGEVVGVVETHGRCSKVRLLRHDIPAGAKLYTAPLSAPVGVDVQQLAEQASAWEMVFRTLDDVSPGWRDGKEPAMHQAAAAIRALAQQPAAVDGAWQVQLADALECFWNAAIEGSGRDRDNIIGGMVQGFAAVATRLREHAAQPQGASHDDQ